MKVAAVAERDREQHPVGRAGKPEDIAQASPRRERRLHHQLLMDSGMTVKMIYGRSCSGMTPHIPDPRMEVWYASAIWSTTNSG